MNKLYDTMIQKTFRCLVMGWHSNPLHNNVSIYLNKKFHLKGSFKGGVMTYFETSISGPDPGRCNRCKCIRQKK